MDDEAPSLLAGIPASALAGLERRRFPAGAVIVAEGDYPRALYILLSGAAEVMVADRQGEDHLVGQVIPGETVGEMSFFTGRPAVGTVRATEPVELVVLDERKLQDLARRFPRIYRNLVAIMALRLARTDQLAIRERPGRLVVIEDCGGPAVLARALAASVAWHTRTRTALVAARADAGAEQLPQIGPRDAGIDTVTVAPEALEPVLEELRRQYDHVLLHAGAPLPPGDAFVRLGAPGGGRGLTLDGFRDGQPPPFRGGAVQVPALTPADEDAVRTGMLGTASAAGAAMGWVARDVSDLRVGIALGSGSLRGYAHLGALRALERNGIPIDCLAGTSIGALIGAAYSYFRDTERVAEILDNVGRRLFRPALPLHSLLSTRAVQRYVRANLGDAPLEELPIPLAIVSADLLSHDEVVLERGSTVRAVLAATALPGIYPPVLVGKRVLVDGGLLNPVPVATAAALGAGIVVGIRIAGGTGAVRTGVAIEPGEGRLPTVLATILGAMELVQARFTTEAREVRTVSVVPEFGPLPEAKIRNFSTGRAYIEAGEVAVEAALPRLSAAIPWLKRA